MKSIESCILRKMLINGANLIEVQKEYVDSLNVFPVPDGDTGTNMSLTMASAAKEVLLCSSSSIADLCNALSTGALRGARGNSGVILSQILKGIATALADSGCSAVTVKNLAKALESATAIAYKAVTKPQEGTMLTVVRGMSEAAVKIAKKTDKIDEFFIKVIKAGEDILKKTPEMLPALKKAGVIDAGGRGLLVIFTGFYNAVIGKEETELVFDDRFCNGGDVKFDESAHFNFTDLAEIEFAYCTEFVVINLKEDICEVEVDAFREFLLTQGDSVLVIGDLSLIKVHVHTNDPGAALSRALKLGEVDKIKIDNMLEQNRVLVAGSKKEDLKPFGMVAVSAGDGLSSIFKDLLVDVVVRGGQTMNPCANDIASACDRVAATDVFVFPNNKNIILAAEQAKEISKRNIHVMPTRSIPEGLSAVLNFNPDRSLEQNLNEMKDAIGEVKSGAVTFAVRNATIDDVEVKKGDLMGLNGSTIATKGKKIEKVVEDLVEQLLDEDSSSITLYYGSDVKERQAQVVADAVAKKFPGCDVDVLSGGQPIYYYIVGVE